MMSRASALRVALYTYPALLCVGRHGARTKWTSVKPSAVDWLSSVEGCAAWEHHDDVLPAAYGRVLKGGRLERALAPAARRNTTTRLARVLRRALTDQQGLRLVSLGGSVPLGQHCRDPSGRGGFQCAWSSRLARSLAARFQSNVTILNFNYGGTSSRALLGRLPDLDTLEREAGWTEGADCYIIDTNKNDAGFSAGENFATVAALVSALRQRGGEVLYLETVAHPGSLGFDRKTRQRTRRMWQLCDVHASVLTHLGVPYVSYRDAIWPNREAPEAICTVEKLNSDNTTIWPEIEASPGLIASEVRRYVCWDGRIHPSWAVHQILADIISVLFSRLALDCPVSSAPLPRVATMTTLQPNRAACIEQRAETYLAASNGNDGFPALKNGRSWRFAEDVPGKPGWISESSLPWRPGEAGDIAFSVQTADASHPAVSLTYLRSYHTPTTRMGRLAVNITCHQTTHHIGTLDGAWDDLVSLETTFDFSGFSELGGAQGKMPLTKGANRSATCLLRLRPLPPPEIAPHGYPGDPAAAAKVKFKLLGITTC